MNLYSPRGLDVEPCRFDPRAVLGEGDVREEHVHARSGEELSPQDLHELRLVAWLHLRGQVLEELQVYPQPRHGRYVAEVRLLALELLDDTFYACLNLRGEQQKSKCNFTVSFED